MGEETQAATMDVGVISTQVELPQEQETPLTRQQCTSQATQSAKSGDFDAAIAWCSRALSTVELSRDTAGGNDAKQASAAAALYLRRAEYALQAKRYEDALQDADLALKYTQDKQLTRKALRLRCRALVATDRSLQALAEWTAQFSMQSPVLDALAFRLEFGVEGDEEEDRGAVRYQEALEFLYRRDFGNAISHLTKILDVNKKGKSKNKDPVVYLLRARCRLELKEFEGAVADAERVITLLPTAVEGYRWLCEALIALKKYPQASKVCKAGLSISQDDEALLAIRGRLPKKQDKPKKSKVQTAEETMDYEEGEEHGDAEAGTTEKDQEDPAFEAIRQLKRELKMAPGKAVLYVQIARLRLGLKQFEQAHADSAEAIALDSSSGEAYVCACESLYGLRRYAKALRVCEQGLRLVEDQVFVDNELRVWEDKLLAALINPPPEVETLEEDATKPKSRVPKVVAARRQERAQRKVDDAQSLRRKCYEKAVDLADGRDFGNAVYWLNKAEGYDAAGEDFYGAQIYALRARCRFELKQYEHVGNDAEKAIALDPTDADSYRWLSLSLKTRGRMDEAVEACEAGLERSPDHKGLLALQRSLSISKKASS